MTAMPRSLSLLIGCALLAATSSAARPTTAHAMTPRPTGAVGGRLSTGMQRGGARCNKNAD
jgi:hypothetical protein